jgi:hypothetical protein
MKVFEIQGRFAKFTGKINQSVSLNTSQRPVTDFAKKRMIFVINKSINIKVPLYWGWRKEILKLCLYLFVSFNRRCLNQRFGLYNCGTISSY